MSGRAKTRILEAGNLESLTESQRHRQRARGRHRFNQVAVLGLNREFGKFVEYVIDVQKYAPAVLAIKIQMKIDQLIGPGHEVSRILRWHDAAPPRLIREIEAPDRRVLRSQGLLVNQSHITCPFGHACQPVTGVQLRKGGTGEGVRA